MVCSLLIGWSNSPGGDMEYIVLLASTYHGGDSSSTGSNPLKLVMSRKDFQMLCNQYHQGIHPRYLECLDFCIEHYTRT